MLCGKQSEETLACEVGFFSYFSMTKQPWRKRIEDRSMSSQEISRAGKGKQQQ
jgi:hypothetical protein